MKKVACCIPLSWDFLPKLFFISWQSMNAYAIGRYELMMLVSSSCYLDEMRDNLGKLAIKYKPDYILWLDADETYHEKTPEILMKHIDSGKSIVGGITPNKVNQKPLIYDIVSTEGTIRRNRDIEEGQGLVKVDSMGFGGIMMKPKVLEDMKFPWFKTQWNPKIKERPGEDVKFYCNCKEAGIDVWCDTNLIYGHVATVALSLAK